MPSIVYALTNPVMRHLVKIGMTKRDDLSQRMNELYSTGVPLPFECAFAVQFDDDSAMQIERALHDAFDPYRLNNQREFFEIESDQVTAILNTYVEIGKGENVTSSVNSTKVDAESSQARERFKGRRPTFNFREMGIPNDAILDSRTTADKAIVVSERSVRFRDEVVSLTKATQLALDTNTPVPPMRHWSYNGDPLQNIYDETY